MLVTKLQTTGIVSGKELYKHYKELYAKFYGGLTAENFTSSLALTNTKIQGSGQQLVIFTFYISAAEYAAQAVSSLVPWKTIGLPKLTAVYTPLYMAAYADDIGTKTLVATIKHGSFSVATFTDGTASGSTIIDFTDAYTNEYAMQTQFIQGALASSFTTTSATQEVLGLFVTTKDATAISVAASDHIVITLICKVAMI